MREAGVDLRLEGLDGLLVGEGQRFGDELVHGAVGVRAWCVDPGEERLEEGALARRGLRQPAPELELGAKQGVGAGVGADEHEAADELRVAKRELLRDRASHREAGDVGGGHVECAQDRCGVVGHRRYRKRLVGRGERPTPRLSNAVTR